ncbi:MAG: site-specific integrase [Planctomycetaceae bacterium]|nr:site-specific integrase [Planctomycetaceae bacterium]
MIDRPKKSWRIRIRIRDERLTISFPGMKKPQVQEIEARLLELRAATLSATQPPPATLAWVAQIDDKLHAKLLKHGLVSRRFSEEQSEDPASQPLMDYVDRFVSRGYSNQGRKVSPLTIKKWNTTVRYMRECFGPLSLANATQDDALDFVDFLWDQDGTNEENTVRKHCQIAQMFFNAAIDADIIAKNPFRKVPTTGVANEERQYNVTRAEFDKCVEACPDHQWKVILYLCRVAGMRCPSELVVARWEDIDWSRGRMTIRCEKTSGHAGRDRRVIPLWAELRDVLRAEWEQSEDSTIITRYRDSSQNLRTTFKKIIERAGLKPWPKLFQNMRASRENELIDSGVRPDVAANWLGHSLKVQTKSYLNVEDHHYDSQLMN